MKAKQTLITMYGKRKGEEELEEEEERERNARSFLAKEIFGNFRNSEFRESRTDQNFEDPSSPRMKGGGR